MYRAYFIQKERVHEIKSQCSRNSYECRVKLIRCPCSSYLEETIMIIIDILQLDSAELKEAAALEASLEREANEQNEKKEAELVKVRTTTLS